MSATELPTDFTFTGQREAAEIGLKYYGARWYDSEISHFLQAETYVPNMGNPLAWIRYSYVKFNPVNFFDPSGNTDIINPSNGNGVYADYHRRRNFREDLASYYGVTMIGKWSIAEMKTIWDSMVQVNSKLDEWISESSEERTSTLSGIEIIKKYFSATYRHGGLFGKFHVTNMTDIWLEQGYYLSTVIHENMHVLDNRFGFENQSGTNPPSRPGYASLVGFQAIWFGGGAADLLFEEAGGTLAGWRWNNGDNDGPYYNMYGKGVMVDLLPDFVPDRNWYGNHSSADFFAATGEALFVDGKYAPEGAKNWLRNFLINLP